MVILLAVIVTLWVLALAVLAMAASPARHAAQVAVDSDERIVRPLVVHHGGGQSSAAA